MVRSTLSAKSVPAMTKLCVKYSNLTLWLTPSDSSTAPSDLAVVDEIRGKPRVANGLCGLQSFRADLGYANPKLVELRAHT